MFRLRKRIGVAVVLGLTLLAFSAPKVEAQSPDWQIRRGLTVRQAASNIATLGQALSFVPPYALGFNPYARGRVNPVVNPLLNSYATPAANSNVNPYASLYAASLYSNPYASMVSSAYGGSPGYDNSYNPYMSGYGYNDPYGGYLRGGADVINAQGRFMVNTQDAYLKREQVRSSTSPIAARFSMSTCMSARKCPPPRMSGKDTSWSSSIGAETIRPLPKSGPARP